MNYLFLYEKSGACGIVLVILAMVSLYFFIKNSLYLWWVCRDFKAYFDRVEKGKEDLIESQKEASSNPLIGIIQGVATSHATHSKDLRAEVAYLFHRQFQSVIGGLTALRLISVISPLIGLMGTVLGMVKVFQVVASQTQANPALMAGGIWEALLTTIMGLIVAIPTLIFFYFLKLKMNGFQIEAVEYGYRTLGIINPGCPYGKKSLNQVAGNRCRRVSDDTLQMPNVEVH